MSVQALSQLAVFGGQPAFSEKLHVGRPNIGDRARLMKRIEDLLDRRWITNDGPYVKAFERRVADLCEVEHCVAMCNGTIALEILFRAAGLKDEVIVPSFTFVATAHALQWQEIKPVFCDVAPGTHTIDPRRVEELITPRTSGIVGVHVFGKPCLVEELQEIADRRGLPLLFDASHAFTCSHGGRKIGGFGTAEVFSFHATKFCNTFEGGAVVTNDGDLAERMRFMRNFGFSGADTVRYLGSNGKMSEVCAAMGLTNIESLEEFVAANKRNYERYRELLSPLPGVDVIDYDERDDNNYHYVVLEVDPAEAGISRDDLVRVLQAENVLARRYFYPGAHEMEPYRSYQPQAHLVLPRTIELCTRVMTLPTGPTLSVEDVERVASIVTTAVENGPAVTEALAER